MNKSQIRKKILKIRKNNFNKNLKINTNNFISFLKINTNNVGGYYPSNYEIDDLEILDLLEKKNFNIYYFIRLIRYFGYLFTLKC